MPTTKPFTTRDAIITACQDESLARQLEVARRENERLQREAQVMAFKKHQEAFREENPVAGSASKKSPTTVGLKTSSGASADAWARLRSSRPADLSPVEKEILSVHVERHAILERDTKEARDIRRFDRRTAKARRVEAKEAQAAAEQQARDERIKALEAQLGMQD